MTETLARVVHNTAPPECPDRRIADGPETGLDLHKYTARFADALHTKVECLGTMAKACDDCGLRVPSYTARIRVGRGRHKEVRVRESDVIFNPVKRTNKSS